MSYIVISDLEVCGKLNGDSLTEKELIDAGANIGALIEAGHIKPASNAKPAPTSDQGEN